ncbi:hypothetical protein NON20_18825 [Synechocystis sp. B12]|nr:hypothetical protein NON20_18825 [Synechocystis sp. B12]
MGFGTPTMDLRKRFRGKGKLFIDYIDGTNVVEGVKNQFNGGFLPNKHILQQ